MEVILLEGKDVLVVEDDPVFRNMIVGFLESQGCLVQEADNGLEGLRALREHIPDLLLCDLAMPVMTGMEFVEEVAIQYPMIPVIVISGTGEMADVALALRLGVKDFLIKPLDNILMLKSSMLSVLRTQNSAMHDRQDFSNRWFATSEESEPVEEELAWHLKELQNNPKAARDLLVGLMPDTQSSYGHWQLNYCVLQSAEILPVLLDYTWLFDGQLAFYLIDTSSGGDNATATALLIRAFFNEYLRNQGNSLESLSHLVAQLEQGMKHSGYASPVKGLFGLFDLSERCLHVLPAGINAQLRTSENNYDVNSGHWLGQQANHNTLSKLAISPSGGRLSLSQRGHASFSVNFKYLNL